MKNKFLAVAVLVGATFSAFAALPPGTLAVVNGKAISTETFDFLIAQAPASYLKDKDHAKQLKGHVKEQLIRATLILQEAEKAGFQSHKDVRIAQTLASQDVLVRAFVKDYMASHVPTEGEVKAAYEKMKSGMKNHELHLHHILVSSEKEATMVRSKLSRGARFEEMAKKYSKDSLSKAKGGDLGWSSSSVYVKTFSAAAEALKDGQLSAPVKTQFGYHIIRRDASRPVKLPTLDSVKPQIQQMLAQEGLQKHIEDLRKKAVVQE